MKRYDNETYGGFGNWVYPVFLGGLIYLKWPANYSGFATGMVDSLGFATSSWSIPLENCGVARCWYDNHDQLAIYT